MCPTTLELERVLFRACQELKSVKGQLDAAARSIDAGAHRIFVGDVVSTRYNARRLVTNRHLMVKNRVSKDEHEFLE